MALGLGLDESSDQIKFKDIKSTSLALRRASWQTTCVLDTNLPITFDANVASAGLSNTLDKFSDLLPIVRIATDELCGGAKLPSFSVDVDFK